MSLNRRYPRGPARGPGLFCAVLLSCFVSMVFIGGLAPTASACKCKVTGAWKVVSDKAPYIVEGKFIRHESTHPGLAVFQVSKVIRGEVSNKTLEISGSGGKDCRRPVGSLTEGFVFRLALVKDPGEGPQPLSTCVENIIPAPGNTVDGVLPSGWPWAMLRLPQKPLVELEGGPKPDAARLKSMGVRKWRGFIAENPALWLFVFEFATQRAAIEALPELTRQIGPLASPPYSGDSVINGAYLLVVGFPSSKPPSPKMIEARDIFVGAFAGEE